MNQESTTYSPCRPETILFIGAGASAKLGMPPTNAQAEFLFDICDADITEDRLNFGCFDEQSKKDICQFCRLLTFEHDDIGKVTPSQLKDAAEAFPEANDDERRKRIIELRRQFDLPALRLIAKCRKDYRKGNEIPENFLQEIFNMIDVLLKDNRGFSITLDDGNDVYISPDRLRAAREMMILLGNIMFGCAYQKTLQNESAIQTRKLYKQFAEVVTELMVDEAKHLENSLSHGTIPPNGIYSNRAFYLYSYAILTTNFEPIFLWLFYQAHLKYNREHAIRLGSPGRKLQLMIDFPNTLAMRQPAEGKEKLSQVGMFPVTEAVAQRLNDTKHLSDRIVRVGKYYFVHGSSNFRHCPRCGRLNLSVGDSWEENSPSLFAPGPTRAFAWGIKARTNKEKEAHRRGEYDAMECLFCGALTHANDNFMYMQTQLKTSAPSFIKEITDEALAGLPYAKHIVLLGYRLPPDDTIWTATLFAMLNRNKNRKVYCSVICGYEGPDKWLYGDELLSVVKNYRHTTQKDAMGAEAIDNALGIFGKDYVRAYTHGIPQVFHNGNKEWIREMMYPTAMSWKSRDEIFDKDGVKRSIGE